MALINIHIKGEDIGGGWTRVTVGESKPFLMRKLSPEELAARNERDAAEAALEPAIKRYRYIHRGSCGDGPCARCAPWIGVEFDWDGETTIDKTTAGWTYKTTVDGVPVTQMHPYCDCFVSPVEADDVLPAETGEAAETTTRERFEYLESMSDTELAGILGRVRAELVRDGIARVADLYDEDYNLIPLKNIGFSNTGAPIYPSGKPRKQRTLMRTG